MTSTLGGPWQRLRHVYIHDDFISGDDILMLDTLLNDLDVKGVYRTAFASNK